MRKRIIICLFTTLFIVSLGSSGHAGIKVSAQAKDSVMGSFKNDRTKKDLVWFSAKLEEDFITIRLSFKQKSITLRKVTDELYVASDSEGDKYGTLTEEEKLVFDDLANALTKRFHNKNELHRRFTCLLRFLASWPPDMPLSVSMDASTITIAEESVSREQLDEVRYQALLNNMEAELSSDEADTISADSSEWKSLCKKIGYKSSACYPTKLVPKVITECEFVLVGGTECTGRCGRTCSGLCDGNRYTVDCLNHDRCADVYGISHRYCNYIFPPCSEDCSSAPDCDGIPGAWDLVFDWECDGESLGTTSWYIYPDKTFKDGTGNTGKWAISGSTVLIKYATGCKPAYRAKLGTKGLNLNGKMKCTTEDRGGCWSAKKTDQVLPKKNAPSAQLTPGGIDPSRPE